MASDPAQPLPSHNESALNPMNVREGQRWTHLPPNGGRHTDYLVTRVWKHKARFFADHGNFTETATVFLTRMTPDEWRCLDA